MFFPVNFSNYDDYISTRFTCPHCSVSTDVNVSWKSVVHEHSTIGGAKSQFGPLEAPHPLFRYKMKIDVPLNLWAHVEVACPACFASVTAYFDCQAGGRHGESQYAIAAVKVGDEYIVDGLKSSPPERRYSKAPVFDAAVPTAPFYSQIWFNGGQWEMVIPEGWGCHYRGAHEFVSDHGAVLRLGVSGRGKLEGVGRMELPADDMPDFERDLYLVTKVQADNFHGSSPLKREVFGVLTGYWYRGPREDGRVIWCGHFGNGTYGIYVSLVAPPVNEDYCLAAAGFMLASVQFHAQQVGPPSSPVAADERRP